MKVRAGNEVLTNLYEDLRDANPDRRYEAVILLGGHRKFLEIKATREICSEMAANLLPLLNDEHDHIRYYTAVALARLGEKRAIPSLARSLQNEIKKDSALPTIRAMKKALKELLGIL